jgi:hypothetical protein
MSFADDFADALRGARQEERAENHRLITLSAENISLKERLGRVKAKARNLIDIAYNRAIDEAIGVVSSKSRDEAIVQLRRMKRTVREA